VSEKIFITTAIDYVNSLPHIGTAYEKIGADVLARLQRFVGNDVLLQMGNDEHSANVQKAAEAQGVLPKVYCDQMRPKFEDIWSKLNISYNQYIQTSSPEQHKAVNKFFALVHAAGDIEKKDYEGWYCESCEAFYLEKDLEAGLCKNHKTKPKWLKENNYFFKMKGKEQLLLDHIAAHPEFILPEKRRNEVVSFIKQGLEDISITRSSFTWGIPLPIDNKQVIYVWFDALINYLTLIGFADNEAKFKKLWPADLHIVGKDITRFHCIIWPLMLLSAKLPLPKTVFGHGFVYLKGEKMSKSLGNVVTPLDVLDRYPDFGADALRYYLMRGSSFGDDGDFTWDGFIERYNADLANGLGNLAARTLGMVWKYQKGVVQPLDPAAMAGTPLLQAESTWRQIMTFMNPVQSGDIASHRALEVLWAFITQIDQYIDTQAPWTLAKENKTAELSVVMSVLVEAIRQVALLVQPFIPTAAEKIWQAYGFENSKPLGQMRVSDLSVYPALKTQHMLAAEKLNLFPRIIMEKSTTPEVVSSQLAAAPAAPKIHTPKAVLPEQETGLIDIKEFGRVDLRTAKVLEASKVEGADKLLLLQVELGAEKRQIVSGIAQHYKPEDLVGKTIIVVANLKPAKIRGIESFGMLLAAKEGDKLVLATASAEIGSNAKVG
jgi:methionyl-tRNA synthetase